MVGKKTQGKDFNFFKKLEVSNTTFGVAADGYESDVSITFSTQGLFLLNEETAADKVVEYSFNGNTVHGELDPTLPSRGLMFDNRVVCPIWFRVKSGSTGPITIRVEAWGIR